MNVMDGKTKLFPKALQEAIIAHYRRSTKGDLDVTEVRAGLEPDVIIFRVGVLDVPSRFIDDGESIVIQLPLGGVKKIPRKKFFLDVGFTEQPSG